jgi:predicted RNA-binding protein with PIN domain
MFIIIDGYNLLKLIVKSSFASEVERSRFINLLSVYARAHKHEIYVVFDGGSYIRPTKIIYKHITVIYSGINQNADTYIKNYIEAVRSKEILVVSTDRKISSFAKQHGMTALDSIDFYHILHEYKQQQEITQGKKTTELPRKLSDLENPELDALMQESTHVMYKKDDSAYEQTNKAGNAQKLSKKERKLLKIVKKL